MSAIDYTRVNFQDYPNTSTPITAQNLNKLDKGIYDLDIALTQFISAHQSYSKNISWYGTSSTAASTIAKTATTSDGKFSLATGAKVSIKFTYNNTASAPTLNVDSTGAKSIKAYGTTTPTSWWNAGDVVTFTYDGTNWIMGATEGQINQINSDLHKGSVSVTGRSSETIAQLLNRLAQSINFSKISYSSHLVTFYGITLSPTLIGVNSASFSSCVYNGSQLQFDAISLASNSSNWVRAVSSNMGSIANYSNDSASGGTFYLYY
jgi:hypothetical protein